MTTTITKAKDFTGVPYFVATVCDQGNVIAVVSALKLRALKASLKSYGYPTEERT